MSPPGSFHSYLVNVRLSGHARNGNPANSGQKLRSFGPRDAWAIMVGHRQKGDRDRAVVWLMEVAASNGGKLPGESPV
jgi:hypothetical protein